MFGIFCVLEFGCCLIFGLVLLLWVCFLWLWLLVCKLCWCLDEWLFDLILCDCFAWFTVLWLLFVWAFALFDFDIDFMFFVILLYLWFVSESVRVCVLWFALVCYFVVKYLLCYANWVFWFYMGVCLCLNWWKDTVGLLL